MSHFRYQIGGVGMIIAEVKGGKCSFAAHGKAIELLSEYCVMTEGLYDALSNGGMADFEIASLLRESIELVIKEKKEVKTSE
jgi:hypothetical protein